MKNTLAKLILISAVFFTTSTSFKAAKWDLLGTKTVNYGIDRDEIVVGGWEGKFDALKIKVLKAPLNMHKVVVHFANGTEQNLELRNNFKPGSESRVIDLTGDNRIIKSVRIWYDTKNHAKKGAVVEVWGKH